MQVYIYLQDTEDMLLCFELSQYNRIPTIGEDVMIDDECYKVASVSTSYKKLMHGTYSTVYIEVKKTQIAELMNKIKNK